MQLQPYVNFNGRCEEALNFYKQALGAEITMLMRFRDNPEPPASNASPDNAEKILHASVQIGNAGFMASDGHCTGKDTGFRGISLSLSFPTEAKARLAFAAMAEQGKIEMPIAKTFWSPCFGTLTDRFGVMWMIGIQPVQS